MTAPRMLERRWPALVSAALLLTSGVVAGIVTYLWWLPCRGTMLVGTLWELPGAGDFSSECLVRMDSGTPYPLPAAVDGAAHAIYPLAAVAIVLAALAWLVMLFSAPMTRWARLGGVAFAAALILLAVVGLEPIDRDADPSWIARSAGVLVDLTGWLVLILVLCGRRHRATGSTLQLILVLTGATGFGFFRMMLDFMVMITWSQANWDVPPGTGYLPAIALVLAAVGVVVLTLWRTRSDPIEVRAGLVRQSDPAV